MNEPGHGMHPDEQEMIARLPREIAPPRDLWQGIAAAVAQGTSGGDAPGSGVFGRQPSDMDAAGAAVVITDAMLRRLPTDVEPPKAIWTGIAEAFSQPGDSGGAGTIGPLRAGALSRMSMSMLFALAASIAVIAIVGALLVRPPALEVGPDDAPAVLEAASGLLPAELWIPAADSAGMVTESFASARQTYLEQIAAVRDERSGIEALLNSYPDEPALRELWMHVLQTELFLIDEAARVLTMIQSG